MKNKINKGKEYSSFVKLDKDKFVNLEFIRKELDKVEQLQNELENLRIRHNELNRNYDNLAQLHYDSERLSIDTDQNIINNIKKYAKLTKEEGLGISRDMVEYKLELHIGGKRLISREDIGCTISKEFNHIAVIRDELAKGLYELLKGN
jgi:hypothetical protein